MTRKFQQLKEILKSKCRCKHQADYGYYDINKEKYVWLCEKHYKQDPISKMVAGN